MTAALEIAGQQFDQLRAVRRIPGTGRWEFLCNCGRTAVRTAGAVRSEIKRGNRVGCGFCLKKASLIGQKFSRLTVVAEHRRTPSGTVWLCQCDCGGQALRATFALKKAPQGGCDRCYIERCRKFSLTHGGTLERVSRLYEIWSGMLKRCRPNGHRRYGQRGIRVCAEWCDFAAFRDWAMANGYADTLTIDRLDVDGNYEPTNCEWVTRSENSRRRMNDAYHLGNPRKDEFGLRFYLPIEMLFGATP